jgi:2-amino-4-hydroxy-6-hydroxymethyldihydropteridine diphosphokinase
MDQKDQIFRHTFVMLLNELMNKVFLLLGSNLGDRNNTISGAIKLLQEIGNLVGFSSVYQTAAWGKKDQPDFLNQVILLETLLSPQDLLKKIMEIEIKMGRIRANKWAERTIDIDILYFNKDIIVSDHLKIPHPQIQFRRFTLIPLNEIAPELKHPVLNITSAQMLERCEDALEVKKFAVNNDSWQVKKERDQNN